MSLVDEALSYLIRSTPECCTCRHAVDGVRAEPSVDGYSVRLTLTCHGASETVALDVSFLSPREAAKRLIDIWPRYAFMKTWAKASLAKPARAVVFS